MKKMKFHPGNGPQRLVLLGATLLLAAPLHAQINRQPSPPQAPVPQTAHAKPVRHHHAAKGKPAAAQPAPPPQPAAPMVLTSLFDKPPQPATVSLANSTLTIHADNSSLTSILHQVASTSGMKIEGLSQDQRIFGTYGPGDPHTVITSLLEGSGYNVVMLGQTSDGAPRELTLSPRNNMPITQGPSPMHAAVPVDRDDDANEDSQQAPADNPEPPPAPERPTPNSNRTPQQMMQELQQMRQQQQQQQEQQQESQPQ